VDARNACGHDESEFVGVGIIPSVASFDSSCAGSTRASRLGTQCPPDRDGRDKPGHDEGEGSRPKILGIMHQPQCRALVRFIEFELSHRQHAWRV
jgi:hypothetical protein